MSGPSGLPTLHNCLGQWFSGWIGNAILQYLETSVGMLWVSSRWSPRMQLKILQCTGELLLDPTPTLTQNHLAKMSIVLRLRKLGLYL